MLDKLIRTATRAALVAAPLACGDSGTDPVTAADVELFAPVDVLPAGQTAQLEVRVEDEDGNLIGSPDIDFESSSTALATVSSTGLVTGVGEGVVEITATSGAFSDVVEIYVFDFDDLCASALGAPLGEAVRASLQAGDCTEIFDDGSYSDLWFFDLTTERTVTVDIESDDLDTYVELWDEAGNTIEFGGTNGGSNDATVQATVPAGTYFILVNHFPPGSGTYTLTLTTSAAAFDAAERGVAREGRPAPERLTRTR